MHVPDGPRTDGPRKKSDQLYGPDLTSAISAGIVDLYADFYEHSRTTAATYLNGRVVVCVLENILTFGESKQIDRGASAAVIDGRVAFQNRSEDEFTSLIERLTDRSVTGFLSANQTAPGIACELFFLDEAPRETE